MPPPAGQTQYSNRIGVGMFVDDKGATVRYLDQIIDRLRTLKSLSSATSISVRNTYTGGGPGGGVAAVRAEESRVTARRAATKKVVEEETRQLSLLDKHDEEVARRERERAHATTNYVIGEGRRATGALKASLDYEERLRQQHLQRLKQMTTEELKMQEVIGGGRDASITEELMRRKAAMGVLPGDPKLRGIPTKDPDTGKAHTLVGSQERAYEQARQVLRGRPDLQKYLPYLEQQIEAHRKGLYRGPLGDIPREGGEAKFELPPEGHPHRGPERRAGERTPRPSVPTLAPAPDIGMVEVDEAIAARRARIEELRERARARSAAAPRDTFDLPPGTQRDREIYRRWNEDRQRRRLPWKRDMDLEPGAVALRRERDAEHEEYERAIERARRKKAQREADARVQSEVNEQEARVLEAEAAAARAGYRTPRGQEAYERRNRENYERARAEFRSRVRREQSRRARGTPSFASEGVGVRSVRDEQAAFERLPREEQDRILAEQETRFRRDEDARRAARTQAPTARPPVDESSVFARRRTKPTHEGTDRELLSVAQAANTLTTQFHKVETAKAAGLDMRRQAQIARANLSVVSNAAVELQRQLHRPAGQRPPFTDILERLQQLRAQLAQTRGQLAGFNNQLLRTGGPGGPGGGGGGRGQSLWQRGLFGLGGAGAGGIVATALTYQAFGGAQRAIAGVAQASWDASRAHTEATLRLQAQAEMTGRLSSENIKLAQSMSRQLGIQQPFAMDVVAATNRFAQRGGMLSQAPQLRQSLLDIAAARGVSAQELPTFMELAQNEQGRFAEKFLGQRAEVIFRDYARENRGRLSQGLARGATSQELRLYETMTEGAGGPMSAEDLESIRGSSGSMSVSLERLAGSLTEYEREQAIALAIVRKGNELQGASQERANSAIGQIDRTRATIDEAGASLGRFLQTNRTLVDLYGRLTFVLQRLVETGEDLPVTGPGGVLFNQQDINARAEAAASSWSERFSAAIDRAGASIPLFSALASVEGGIQGFRSGGIRGAGEGMTRPFENWWGLMSGGSARDRTTEEARQRATIERNRQFRELVEANRVEFDRPDRTGVDLETGAGFRILSLAEAAKRRDEALKEENAQARQAWADEQRRNEERAVAERERERLLERRRGALERIREIELQGPQTIQNVAQMRADRDNKYVGILVQLETVQERVRKQWGSLGQDAVKLFTALETESGRVELVALRFDSLTRAIEGQSKAARERDELELSTSLTRREEAGVGVTRARVDAARRLVDLETQRQRVLGVGPGNLLSQEFAARQQIEGLQRLGGPGVGLGLEGRAQKRIINDSVQDILSQFPASVVQATPWMREALSRAIEGQMSEARSSVYDALKAETLVTREDARLRQTAAQFATERDRALGDAQSEAERRAIGRSFDRALIQQTEGRSPRELAQLGLFDVRNQAIQREAERGVQEESEARRATIEGLAVNKALLAVTTRIAAALQAGDMSMLLQVENMARANVSVDSLRSTQDLGPQQAPDYADVMFNRYGRPKRRE